MISNIIEKVGEAINRIEEGQWAIKPRGENYELCRCHLGSRKRRRSRC